MPYAENEGVRLYYEVEGNDGAPPVVAHHGFLADLESWRQRGYVDRLRDRFRIILMDGRGHGRSDKPHDHEAYETRTRVFDIVSVLNANNVQRAHYLGYSMGGMLGLSTLIYAPQRFASITAGGASPMRDPARRKRLNQPFREYYEDALQRNAAVKAAADAGRHDIDALEACRAEGSRWGGAEQALRLSPIPVLLFAGTVDAPHDGAKEGATLNPKARFLSIPGKDHAGAAESVEQVIPAMLEMIEQDALEAGYRRE